MGVGLIARDAAKLEELANVLNEGGITDLTGRGRPSIRRPPARSIFPALLASRSIFPAL